MISPIPLAERANVLIVGFGYVGEALGRRLAGDGHRVTGWRRSGASTSGPLRVVAADVASPNSIPPMPPDLDSIVYMVGADATTDSAYETAYVRGVDNVLSAARRQCPTVRRFIFVSSTGVYAQDSGEWVDESSPADAAHFTGRRLLEGEAIVRASGIPSIILRFGGIYGPGRTRLIDSVRDGSARLPDKPKYINLIHRDDCAACIRHLLQLPQPGDLYLGVDAEPADRADIIRWIAQALGVPEPPVGPAPARGGNKRCSNRRLLGTGYSFIYPTFRDGYGSLLA